MADYSETPARKAPPTLSQLVQLLPQELYDQVYEETFSWAPRAVNIVDAEGNFDHPATSLLRVNKATRKKMLCAFYANTSFAFATIPADGIFWRPHAVNLDYLRFRDSSIWCLFHNERAGSTVQTHLYPFGVALKVKGLSSGIEVGELLGPPNFLGFRLDRSIRIRVWGI